MSQGDYEWNRKIVLHNIANGDFGNLGGPPSDPDERLRLIQWAKDELERAAQPGESAKEGQP